MGRSRRACRGRRAKSASARTYRGRRGISSGHQPCISTLLKLRGHGMHDIRLTLEGYKLTGPGEGSLSAAHSRADGASWAISWAHRVSPLRARLPRAPDGVPVEGSRSGEHVQTVGPRHEPATHLRRWRASCRLGPGAGMPRGAAPPPRAARRAWRCGTPRCRWRSTRTGCTHRGG